MKTKTKKEDTRNLFQRGKNDIWHLRTRVQGKLIYVSLHTAVLSKARAMRDDMLLEIQSRNSTKTLLQSVRRQLSGIEAEEQEEQRSDHSGILLIEAFDKFARDPDRKSCKQRQMDNHRANWNRFLDWMREHHPEVQYCRQVTKPLAKEWAADLFATVATVNSYNKHTSSVRYVFTSITSFDDEFTNPMSVIHKRKEEDCIGKEPFTEDELRRIFSSLDEEFKLLAAIGLYTTLRLGSARKLTWEQFTPDLAYMTAVHDKTGAPASLKVPPELKEWLEKVPTERRHGPLFEEYGLRGRCPVNFLIKSRLQGLGIQTQKEVPGMNGRIRTVCIKGFHSFRHTAITLALRNGATVAQVKRLAGHASEKMQELYTHLGADSAGEAAALIGKFW